MDCHDIVNTPEFELNIVDTPNDKFDISNKRKNNKFDTTLSTDENNNYTEPIIAISTEPNRSKFKSIYEKKTYLNTAENINTEESEDYKIPISSKPDSPREFSVTTLDRKLKQIRKDKKSKQKSLINIVRKTTENSSSDKDSREFMLNSSKIDNVMIQMNPSKLINEHLSEIQIRIIGHNRASVVYRKFDKIIGYPVTILSSFLSSTIMMTIVSDNEYNMKIIKYISLVLSLSSFVCSISRDYLNYSSKFQSHELSSKLYTTLLRSIEVRLIKSHLDDAEKRDIFKDIVDQMSIIEQYETPVPDIINSKLMDDQHLMMV
jgi:hypothetical protein